MFVNQIIYSMKKTFIISILAGLLLPAFVFGAGTYERTPEGFEIYNPVSFTLSLNTYAETTCPNITYGANGWGLGFFWNGGYLTPSEIIDSGTLTHTFTENLAFHSYISVELFCYKDGIYAGNAGYLEGNRSYVIFEVGKTPLIPIPSKFIAKTTAYTQELFAGSGVWTLVALVIGLPLAFWFIEKVIDLKNKKVKKISLGKVEKSLETHLKESDWL
jgi:hypothetical protein